MSYKEEDAISGQYTEAAQQDHCSDSSLCPWNFTDKDQLFLQVEGGHWRMRVL